MPVQRYSVNQHPIETLLTWIKSDAIAILEIPVGLHQNPVPQAPAAYPLAIPRIATPA